jgi:hypothetical protein
LRQEAADVIERLLVFLDATEGDPDVEASPDEPTLAEIREVAYYDRTSDDDEDGADDEPSLGFPGRRDRRHLRP